MSYIDTTSNLVKVRGNPPFGFALDSQWYDDKQALEVLTTKLFSDWNDKLSTQVTFSTRTQTDDQDPVRGDDFPSVAIVIADGEGNCPADNSIVQIHLEQFGVLQEPVNMKHLDSVKINLDL